jgi:arylsulfatase A-like enzyme
MNILFIVLDSYRGDYYWEQGAQVSPELWQLQEDFAAFRYAHTTASWTLPSHVSLFTGLYASEHGKHSGASGADLRLSHNLITLADLARIKGYRTGGFSCNPWVGGVSGLDRGFDLFVEFSFKVSRHREGITDPFPLLRRTHRLGRHLASGRFGLLRRPWISNLMIDGLLRFIQEQSEQKPFFAFINLMDAHNPYQPAKRLLQQSLAGSTILPARKFNREFGAYVAGRRVMNSSLLANTRAYYKASLAHCSQHVARIIEFLKHTGRYEDTAIFICSDHGKTLGEYERFLYPLHYITDINTQILLLAKSPHLKPGEQDLVVSLIDISYSVLRLLGESTNPNGGLQRPRLEDRKRGKSWAASETLIPYVGKPVLEPDLVRSITNDRFKYAHSAQRGEILWDRQADPKQMKNVILDHPGVLQDARKAFQDWQDSLLPCTETSKMETSVENLDTEVQERLRALGYL